MNKIEELKAQKDGIDVGEDIPRYARLGVEAIHSLPAHPPLDAVALDRR